MNEEIISKGEVKHIAKLAMLDLSDSEIEMFQSQLAKVLEHANSIAGLDLSGIEPTQHPFELENVLRKDEPKTGLKQSEVLDLAADTQDGHVKVPPMIA
jgi:aspartyl-tRNA(Asn)/glutamyl-tRNA(Gln) amidotransferase subunit C